jgi:hypothetical protein
MKSSSSFPEDRIVGILIFASCLAYGWGAWKVSGLRSDDFVGPSGFPALIAIAGVGLSCLLILKPSFESNEGLGGLVWAYWGAFLFYAAVMPLLGFGISSMIFLASTFLVLRAKISTTIAVSVIATSVLLLVFGYLFDLRITFGPWG